MPYYLGPAGTGTMNISGAGSLAAATQLVAVGNASSISISTGGELTTPIFNTSSGSTLNLSLDGDGIAVSGMATLAGTLNVLLGTVPDPTLGQSFDLLTFGSESGNFNTINLPPLDPGLSWNTQQLYTNGSITVNGVPEPVGLSLLSIGTAALCRRRGSRRASSVCARPSAPSIR